VSTAIFGFIFVIRLKERGPNFIYLFIFQIQKALFNGKLNLQFKKLEKCYTLSRAAYGAETWILGNVDQKYIEGLKCGAGKGWKRSVGPIV